MQETQQKKIIRYAIVAAVVVSLIIGFFWFFANSWITIKTASKTAEITFIKNGITITKSAAGSSFFGGIEPGEYTVMVKDGDKMSARYITASGGRFQSYDFSLVSVSSSRVVISTFAYNLTSDGSGIAYIDSDNQTAGYFRLGDQVQNNAKQYHFSQIAWFDTAHGYGIVPSLVSQTPTKVVLINNGSITETSIPTESENTNQSVAMAPNLTGWFAAGKSLYRQDGANLKRIYSANRPITVLSATNESVLVAEAITSDGDSMTMRLDRISNDGTQTKGVEFGFHADPNLSLTASYSPDGSIIVLSSMGTAAIYTKDFKPLEKLPLQTEIASVAWKDNATLLYVSKNHLLSYSLAQKVANVIGSSESGSTMTELSYNKTTNSVYSTVVGGTTGNTIQHINLDSAATQQASDTAKILLEYLPREYSIFSCRATFTTVTKPIVIIQQRPGSNSLQNAADCEDAVKQTFERYKIDPNQFTYQRLLP